MQLADPSILEGLAEAQAAFHPPIPDGVMEAFTGPADPGADPAEEASLLVDIGAGPGHSTRALRCVFGPRRPIVAIEPVQDLRRVLLRGMASDPELQVLDCPAEAPALPDAIAGLMVVSNRFALLDGPRFLEQAHRVLRPGGVLVLMQHRPVRGPAMAALDGALGADGAATLAEAALRDLPDPALLTAFTGIEENVQPWSIRRDARGLVDLYLADAHVWWVVRRLGLGRILPALLAVCAEAGIGPEQEIAMESRALICRKPG